MDSNWDGLMRFRRVMKQFAGPFPVVPDIYWCVNTGNGHVTSARPRGLAVTGRYASGIFTPPTPHYPDTSGSHADHMRRAGGISFNQPFPPPPPPSPLPPTAEVRPVAPPFQLLELIKFKSDVIGWDRFRAHLHRPLMAWMICLQTWRVLIHGQGGGGAEEENEGWGRRI